MLQTALLQSLLAGLGDDSAVWGGLHALDGVLAIGVAATCTARPRPEAGAIMTAPNPELRMPRRASAGHSRIGGAPVKPDREACTGSHARTLTEAWRIERLLVADGGAGVAGCVLAVLARGDLTRGDFIGSLGEPVAGVYYATPRGAHRPAGREPDRVADARHRGTDRR